MRWRFDGCLGLRGGELHPRDFIVDWGCFLGGGLGAGNGGSGLFLDGGAGEALWRYPSRVVEMR